jgi:hypothetical protein
LRRSETLSITIETTFDRAWDFITDPENLHLWTVDFALETPEKEGEIYRVKTPRGVIDLFVRMEKETGNIDFYFGRVGHYQKSSSRLVELKRNSGVEYYFTQSEPDNAPTGLFEKLVSNVREELKILKGLLES